MNRTVAIIQPSFLPWRGYFQIISRCDAFVFYDDVQYDRRGWRNRNRIKTASGPQWISVPVVSKGKYYQSILDTEIFDDGTWQRKILGTVRGAYRQSPYFEEYFSWLERRLSTRWNKIADLDIALTEDVCGFLSIRAGFSRSSQLPIPAGTGKVERLVEICRHLGATHYLSGPSARDYIADSPAFEQAGIMLEYVEYDVPPYPQLHGDYVAEVSVLDALFNCGPATRELVIPARRDDRGPRKKDADESRRESSTSIPR